MKNYLLLAAGMLTLASCAEQKSSGLDANGVHKVPAANLSAAQRIAQKAEVTCEAGTQCSASVGLLSIAESDGAAQCTGTLVGPNLVATNAHCVPADIKEGDSCENRIWLTFADAPGFEKQLACGTVLKKHKDKTEDAQSDYAFLQMKETSKRPAMRISRLGVSNGLGLKVEKVDPTYNPDRIQGTQVITRCRSVQQSLAYTGFTSDYSSAAFLSDCKIIGGNSGSAMVGPENTIRGVVFAEYESSEIAGYLKKKNYVAPEDAHEANLATNFSCINIPAAAGAGEPAQACKFPKNPNTSLANREESIRLYAQGLVEMLSAQSDGMKSFDWSYVVENESSIRLVPTCYRGKESSEKIVGPLTWDIETKLDSYYRFDRADLAKSSAQEKAVVDVTFYGDINVRFPGAGRSFDSRPLRACN